MAVYYYLTLLECRNGKDNEMCKQINVGENPKKNENKYIEIPYGEIFDKVLNSKPIS